MRISELNGDSTVTDVTFASSQIKCRFVDGETEIAYQVSIPSNVLYSQNSSERGSIHVRLLNLQDILPIEPDSQRYLPPKKFEDQMNAAKQGFMLAVGLKCFEWPLFLQIRGYQILIACPIQNEGTICVEPIEGV
jgi:hypothetical protein